MLEPQRHLVLQLASFLAISLGWQFPDPSLATSGKLERPVIGSEIVNQYRQSGNPYSAGHRGVDYLVKLGQGVFAPESGVVHFVGQVVDRPLISLSHQGNLLSSFEPVCSSLQIGQQVQRGDLIGEVCEAKDVYHQHCTSAYCLHFSIRRNGEYLSPMWFTGELSASRLLPWVDPKEF